MGWYNGLHSIPIQHRCRQPGAVAQMLHEAHDGQDVALQASPCPRGFVGKPRSHGAQYLSDRGTNRRG